jgi:hypothetical protein
MRARLIWLFSLAVVALPAPSVAADLSPGLWEISLEMRVAASPDFLPAPFLLTQCMTEQDARDPAKFIGGMSNPGASGCTYSSRAYTGSSFAFTMNCAGAYAIQSRGEVSFGADSLNGTITATANLGGKDVETTNRISARRLGGC